LVLFGVTTKSPSLGAHLQWLREAQGLDLASAAASAGITNKRLRDLEAGDVNATLIEVWRLAGRYGTSVDAIVEATGLGRGRTTSAHVKASSSTVKTRVDHSREG
jgi:transcriptional regulator with XRE-family HTH domain